MNRRMVLAGLATSAAAVACATRPPAARVVGPMLRGADIRGDIAILRRAYTELHPGLHRYATPAQVARELDALERDFGADQTLGAAYLRLSRFLSTVKCGHTYANFYNQSDAVVAALFEGRTRLPFHFRWLDGRMIVTRSFAGEARLAPGTEVVAVDGRAAADVLRALLPLARADGGNDAKRRALMEVRGYDRFETFDVFHPLLFAVRDAAVALKVRGLGGRVASFSVGAQDLAQRRAVMRPAAEDEDGDAEQWTFAMRGKTAVLTMPNWALYDSKWDWRGFLGDAFAQLQRSAATGLIVDVRGNEGGLDCGDAIIARMIDRDLPRGAEERRVRYRKTPDDLNPFLSTWDDSFRDWGDDAIDLGNGFYRLKGETEDEGLEVIRPEGPRFSGKLLVLTDAQNSSATFQFAHLVQQSGLGRLCGGPTGGNLRGINGGAFFFLRLPASGLEVDVPLIGRFPQTPMPDAGLMPDIAVQDTAADIAAGRDSVMDAAMAVLG
jgi:hypothetical protein